MQTKVGYFALPTTIGNHTFNIVGFRPKVVLFWGGNGQAPNLETDAVFHFGMATETEQFAYGMRGAHNETAARTRTRRSFVHCITLRDGLTAVTIANVALHEFTDEGFTLNVQNIDSKSRQVNFLAIGGNIEAKIGNGFRPMTPSSQSVDVGFRPDSIIGLFPSRSSDEGTTFNLFGGIFGLGAYSKGNQFASATQMDWETTPTFAVSDHQAKTFSSRFFGGNITSLTDTGFNISWNGNVDGEWRYVWLALKGVTMQVGDASRPLSSPQVQTLSTPGVTPSALLMWGHDSPEGPGWTHINQCMGAWGRDPFGAIENPQACSLYTYRHNVSTTEARTEQMNGEVGSALFRQRRVLGQLVAAARYHSHGEQSISIDWTNITFFQEGLDRRFMYIVFGEPFQPPLKEQIRVQFLQ